MATKITATELAKNLTGVVNRFRCHDEWFVVERNDEPMASLVPVSAPPGITTREFVARLGHLALPGDSFADALEAIQAAQLKAEFQECPS